MNYAFKDTDLARQRLQVLANVFAPSTREFLHACQHIAPRTIIDLGCGPGYTTHLLADMYPVANVTGLEASERFIAHAQQTAQPHISFIQHDITIVPFPVEPADLLYCRFLLTHLEYVPETIERWATQLQPGGLLLLEEVEWIQTRQPVFSRYLQIVAALLEHQKHCLYIGPFLHTLPDSMFLHRRMSRVGQLQVATADAAQMFLPNLQTWRNQPFIQEHFTTEEIDRLEQELRALVHAEEKAGEIE